MRKLFVFIVLVNIAVFARGLGWLGTPPSEEGRTPQTLASELHPEAVVVESARAD